MSLVRKGQLVLFRHPSRLAQAKFGIRAIAAKTGAESLKEERKLLEEKVSTMTNKEEINKILTASKTPVEGYGIILNGPEFYDKIGAGNWYYKVFMGEGIYWIAREHLTFVNNEGNETNETI